MMPSLYNYVTVDANVFLAQPVHMEMIFNICRAVSSLRIDKNCLTWFVYRLASLCVCVFLNVILSSFHHSLCMYVCYVCFNKDQSIDHARWKKCSERCKHCTLAVVRQSQKISPRRRLLPGGAGRPKFNQLQIVTTDPVWWRSMHAILSYHGNRPTNRQTDRTDYNTLRH